MGGATLALAGTGEPARGLSPDRVARLARELAAIDAARFCERYDREGLEEYQIPPGDWSDEVPDWLLGEYEALRRLFLTAARHGEGILLWPL